METIVIEKPVKTEPAIDSIDWSCRSKDERQYPKREWGEGNFLYCPVKTIEQPFLQKLIDMGAILTDNMGEWTIFAADCYVMFHVYDGFINLECIATVVDKRRNGSGTKVMNAIVAAAKETNTEIRLRACNVTGGRMNIFRSIPNIAISEGTKTKNKIPTAKLAAWYKKFGFVKVANVKHRGKNAGVNMVYNPQK